MLIENPEDIRLAMIGMVQGNGHPYSWSAIINGDYDAGAMAACGYPAIPDYLGAEPPEALGIPGVRVSHVYCEDPAEAAGVAKAACIAHVVARPEDVLGEVDGVIISTDIGGEHVERARPFIDAGLPLFIDKPLCDNEADLAQFIAWQESGHAFLSTSCMRYAKEFQELQEQFSVLGEPRLITVTMAKSWERYGIHALEAVYPFCRAGGYRSVTHAGTTADNVMHLDHEDGATVLLNVFADLTAAFGHVNVYGSKASAKAQFSDTFSAFKRQLEVFVAYLRTGETPFAFAETIEQMKIIIAGIRSREAGGKTIDLSDIKG